MPAQIATTSTDEPARRSHSNARPRRSFGLASFGAFFRRPRGAALAGLGAAFRTFSGAGGRDTVIRSSGERVKSERRLSSSYKSAIGRLLFKLIPLGLAGQADHSHNRGLRLEWGKIVSVVITACRHGAIFGVG